MTAVQQALLSACVRGGRKALLRGPTTVGGSNLGNAGLLSTDRSDKGYSTAYKTRFQIQVVCKGFGSVACRGIAMRGRGAPGHVAPRARGPPATVLSGALLAQRARVVLRVSTSLGGGALGVAYRRLTSTDSDLEAFSRDPTGGSVAALAGRPAANTKYPNQWFLSY